MPDGRAVARAVAGQSCYVRKELAVTARWLRVVRILHEEFVFVLLELELDDARPDDELTVTPIFILETTNLLRTCTGCGSARISPDNKSFAIGALHAALWKAYDTPIRVPMVAGGVDLNPSGETTATPRRRLVREARAGPPGRRRLSAEKAGRRDDAGRSSRIPRRSAKFHYHVSVAATARA